MTKKNPQIIIRKLLRKNESETITINKNEQKTIVLVAKSAVTYSLDVELQGQGAHAVIIGFLLGKDNDEINIHTLQKHTAPNTVSDLHIKGILRGRSYVRYEGFIQIEKQAQRSNAYQRDDNLLLSDEAKADSKPALEILANDVRCTHGATLGKIDEEQLFYLECRGINRQKAEKLIAEGFFEALIQKIPEKQVQEKVRLLLNET
ncbi:hypothetical protein C4564_05405 [Candidatus Microgenomates bacterium]|nr:MAG: hypothetical protein C4564_05405 [Candidatus Microgenomates bacterium]